jgi:O-methyltransferase involved in polyketide biosynthesis
MNGSELGGLPAPNGLDTSRPNVARVYDYMLGGKDNFEADRAAAEMLIKVLPHSALACRQNRQFLGRVVRYLIEEKGIRQFIDLGSGLPTADNVHQIAQKIDPGARVVYADYDPVVVLHSKVLLEGSEGVRVIQADLRDPGSILGDPGVGELIDLGQPAAILMFAILHFLPDAEQPYETVRRFTQAMAPGSYLALSHITDEAVSPETSQAAQQVYQGASAPVVPRSREDIARFFDGLELTGSGLVDINLWPVKALGPGAPLTFYGGAARKP